MEHNSALGKCLHSLPYGETAICPTHGTHDHHERDEYRNAVLDEVERRISSSGMRWSEIRRIIEDMRYEQ